MQTRAGLGTGDTPTTPAKSMTVMTAVKFARHASFPDMRAEFCVFWAAARNMFLYRFVGNKAIDAEVGKRLGPSRDEIGP